MSNVFTSAKIKKTTAFLIEKGFSEQPACVGDDSKPKHLLIDRKEKTFFVADDEVLEYANGIIQNISSNPYKQTSLQEIKNWN